jgi:plasmid stabilization system protein ParE
MQQTIMRRVVWLDSAINDLIRLKEFLAEKNHEAAKRAAEKIKKIISQLIETPSIGKPVKDLISYRDLYIRFGAAGYVLRYRIYDNLIYIVCIRHYRELEFKIDHSFMLSATENA